MHPLDPPDPPLADDVVTLRPVGAGDVDAIERACQDPGIQQYIPIPRPYRREHAEAYVERAARQWRSGEKAAFTIVGTDDPDELLGVISLNVAGGVGNCGYWVTPAARGHGVARRALRLVTGWAFPALGLAVILLEIHPTNAASMAVAQAAGYHEAGRLDVNTATGKRGGLIFSRLATD